MDNSRTEKINKALPYAYLALFSVAPALFGLKMALSEPEQLPANKVKQLAEICTSDYLQSKFKDATKEYQDASFGHDKKDIQILISSQEKDAFVSSCLRNAEENYGVYQTQAIPIVLLVFSLTSASLITTNANSKKKKDDNNPTPPAPSL
ncbi:MAG: hypothetical protein LRY54_04430 [Alphaproteobacteria bacterium]|nr:hypothetical protein [Alphaproteobacteria bacterium]